MRWLNGNVLQCRDGLLILSLAIILNQTSGCALIDSFMKSNDYRDATNRYYWLNGLGHSVEWFFKQGYFTPEFKGADPFKQKISVWVKS